MVIHNPLHPGLNVKAALIDGTGLSVTEAAEHLGVSRTTLSRLLNEHTGISPEMAMRLSKFFNTSVELLINMQAQYDVWLIKQKKNKIKVVPFDEAA